MTGLLAAALLSLGTAQSPPQAPDTFPVTGVTELRAGWRLSPGDSVAWAQPSYDDRGWREAAVPGTWARQGLPGYRGFAWYRLRYTLDSAVSEPMAVRFTGAATAFEVYADGRRIGGVGVFPPLYRGRSSVPANFSLPAEALQPGAHVLAVRVYSDESRGGIDLPVLAGPLAELTAREFRISFFLVATALLLVGLAVHQVFFWARQPEATEHLYVVGFLGSLGLLFIVWVPPVRLSLSPSLDFYRLYLLFAGMAAAFFCFAFRRIFELDHNRLVGGLGFLSAIIGLAGLLLPGWGALRAAGMYVFNPALLVTSVVITVLAHQQTRRGVEHARALLWGVAVLVVTVAHDIAVEWGMASSRVGLPWVLAGSVGFATSVAYVTARQIVDRAAIALYDRLTGLYRREVVLDALKREIRRAARTRQPLALIMMDIDRFKSVNDSLGHEAGDRVLAEVGRRLTEAGRAVDWLCRYGGEEFLAVLAGSDLPGAAAAAERIRQAVSALPIDAGRASRAVSISAGVSAYDGGPEWPTVETLIGAADAALYRAKAAGRNQVRT